MEFDFYAYVQEQMREVLEESERTFAEYATELGYVKVRRCNDCGSFIPTFEGPDVVTQGVCSYFKCNVSGKHYCSYAWEDEDEDE